MEALLSPTWHQHSMKAQETDELHLALRLGAKAWAGARACAQPALQPWEQTHFPRGSEGCLQVTEGMLTSEHR